MVVGHLKIKLLLTAVDIKHMEKKYVFFLAHEKFARLSTKCEPAVCFLRQATQCNTSFTHVTPALNTSSCCVCFFCRKSFFKYSFPKLPLSLLSGAPKKNGESNGILHQRKLERAKKCVQFLHKDFQNDRQSLIDTFSHFPFLGNPFVKFRDPLKGLGCWDIRD